MQIGANRSRRSFALVGYTLRPRGGGCRMHPWIRIHSPPPCPDPASRLGKRCKARSKTGRVVADSLLEAPEQVASEKKKERGQECFKTVIAHNGYRDMGISNQERKHCEKDCKYEGHLRWGCQIHSLSPSPEWRTGFWTGRALVFRGHPQGARFQRLVARAPQAQNQWPRRRAKLPLREVTTETHA
jgi:hypothetical protein